MKGLICSTFLCCWEKCTKTASFFRQCFPLKLLRNEKEKKDETESIVGIHNAKLNADFNFHSLNIYFLYPYQDTIESRKMLAHVVVIFLAFSGVWCACPFKVARGKQCSNRGSVTLLLPRVPKSKFKTNLKFHFVKFLNINSAM